MTFSAGDHTSPASTSSTRGDPLSQYMEKVGTQRILTREEEHDLAVRSASGDGRARGELIVRNLRMVVKIAHEYKACAALTDLVQEGNIGLMRAVDKFDPAAGTKLSTYANWWIRAFMLKWIMSNWRLVRLGTTQNQRKLFFNLAAMRRQLRAAKCEEPTAEDIADAMQVSVEDVNDMTTRLEPEVSMQATISSTSTGQAGEPRRTLLVEVLPDPSEGVHDMMAREQIRQRFRDEVIAFGEMLKGRELEIFTDRLMSEEPVTLAELGARWGVTRERARQLEARLVARLREAVQNLE